MRTWPFSDEAYGGILPEYHAVIFDEAHEIEDVAGQYFGVGLSNYQFEELARDVSAIARRKQFRFAELDRLLALTLENAPTGFSRCSERARAAPASPATQAIPGEERRAVLRRAPFARADGVAA